MRAYLVVTAEPGKARDIAHSVRALPGVKMADACWGVADIFAVFEFPSWKELNEVVLDKLHHMPGVIRTETHVAIEE
jgi:DNA-binding Lrp family transcriptional regulator